MHAIADESYVNPPCPQHGHYDGLTSNQFVCHGAISSYKPGFGTLFTYDDLSATMVLNSTWNWLPPYVMNSMVQKMDNCKLSLCMICIYQVNEVADTKTKMLTITAMFIKAFWICYLLPMSPHVVPY